MNQGVRLTRAGITDKIELMGYEPLPYFESKWIVSAKENNQLFVEYTIVADPIHTIPAFLYNLAV